METWMAGGIGRAQGGYDEMVFRTMVHEDAYFYDVIGLESEGTTSDFQVGQNSYLYGTRFMSYTALKHGPDKLIEWINRTDGTKAWYQSQFKRVFGVSLKNEWREWIAFEHEWQQKNLAKIREYPLTRDRRLTDRAMGSASRGFYDPDTRKFYTAVNYPAAFAHVVEIDIDTGKMRKLGDVQTPALYYVTSLAFDPAAKKLYYTTNNGKHWRDLNVVDIRTGKHKKLLANNRTGDLVFNRADGTIWGVQHHNGISSLVRFLPPYDSWDNVETIMEAPFGRDVYDIDISPDGEWLTASMVEIDGSSRLVRVSIPALLAGDAGYDVLWQFPKTAPANFVFAPDGKSLQRLLDRRVQRVPLRLRKRPDAGGVQHRDGLLPSRAHPERLGGGIPLHSGRAVAGGFRRHDHRRHPRGTLPGQRSDQRVACACRLEAGVADGSRSGLGGDL
jgi:hypothetical protein